MILTFRASPSTTRESTAVVVATDVTPYMAGYPWNAGFGTKYSDPGTLPTSNAQDIAFTPTGDFVAVAHQTSPSISVYPFTTASGFGTKVANPATTPASIGRSVCFSSSGDTIFVATSSGVYIYAYPWSASGFGTKYADPATGPGTSLYSVTFGKNGSYISVTGVAGSAIYHYPWSAGFGARSTGLGPGTPLKHHFSGSGNDLTIPGSSIPLYTTPWTGTAQGTAYTAPATPPTGAGEEAVISPEEKNIACAHATSPFISAYPFTSGTGYGTKYANPGTLPSTLGASVDFGQSDAYIAVGQGASPWIRVYPFSPSGFGTVYSNPAITPTGTVKGVAFN